MPIRPGPSLLRAVIETLQGNGVCVVPKEWDREYLVTEVNVRLRTNLQRCSLVSHTSFSFAGILGEKVYALKLARIDSTDKRPVDVKENK